jgi:OmpA-OmpF porin, OOP family
MAELPRASLLADAWVGRLALMLLAGGTGIAVADPQGVVDSQSIVRSLAPAPSAHVTRGFTVEGRPASGGAQKIDLDIRFGNNSAELTAAANGQLTELGRALSSPELAHARFLIAGHTSATGSADHNLRLSRSRARSVRSYLLQRFHIASDRLEATGYGASRPLPQFPPEAIEQRRVEVSTLPAQS